MPRVPRGYVAALALHRYFETTSFTREDGSRARLYAKNGAAEASVSNASDLNSFLRSLGMRMRVDAVTELNIERSN